MAMAPRAELLPKSLMESLQRREQQQNIFMYHSARSGFTDLPEGPGKGCFGALGLYFGFQ